MHFLAVKKSIKRSRFVIYSYFKDSAYTASVKRDVKFLTMYVKGVPFVNGRYTKEEPFLSKIVQKKGKGLDRGGGAPLINRAQKFHTNDASLPRSGWCFGLVVLLETFASTNQKHSPGVNLIKLLQV